MFTAGGAGSGGRRFGRAGLGGAARHRVFAGREVVHARRERGGQAPAVGLLVVAERRRHDDIAEVRMRAARLDAGGARVDADGHRHRTGLGLDVEDALGALGAHRRHRRVSGQERPRHDERVVEALGPPVGHGGAAVARELRRIAAAVGHHRVEALHLRLRLRALEVGEGRRACERRALTVNVCSASPGRRSWTTL
jgi:hypothetical protein